jgi:hypothetical protein
MRGAWLSIPAVARAVGRFAGTLYVWDADGDFPAHTRLANAQRRVHRDDLESWAWRQEFELCDREPGSWGARARRKVDADRPSWDDHVHGRRRGRALIESAQGMGPVRRTGPARLWSCEVQAAGERAEVSSGQH